MTWPRLYLITFLCINSGGVFLFCTFSLVFNHIYILLNDESTVD